MARHLYIVFLGRGDHTLEEILCTFVNGFLAEVAQRGEGVACLVGGGAARRGGVARELEGGLPAPCPAVPAPQARVCGGLSVVLRGGVGGRGDGPPRPKVSAVRWLPLPWSPIGWKL